MVPRRMARFEPVPFAQRSEGQKVIIGAVIVGWIIFFGQPGKVHASRDENGTVHMWKTKE